MSASTTKDQYFAGCVFTRMTNNAARSANYYVQKRPGLATYATIAAGSSGTAVFQSPSTANIITAWGGTNSTIYEVTTNAGTMTGICYFITEEQISGVTYTLFASSNGTGWYLVNGATADTSFTGDTHTNTTIDNLSGQSGLYVGQKISGTGITAGTRIASRSPDTSTPTSITVDTATTATNAGVTITKEALAKIISANFPTAIGGFACMDGYAFIMTTTGRIYNSNVNDINTWGANNYISADISTDTGLGCIKYKNHIIAFGTESIEFFYNAGNSSGSILSARKELFSQIGMFPNPNFGFYNSVCQINDNIFWIGNDMGLYTFDGFSPKKLSEMGMSLGTSNYPPYALSCYRLGVDTIIHINSSNPSYEKWFSVNTGMWTEPVLGITGATFFNNPVPTTTNVGLALGSGGSTGILYNIDTGTYQDGGAAFTMTIQTELKVLNKGSGFTIPYVDLIADNQSSGSTTLEISRDDYATWETIGTFDLTKTKKRIHRCGFCRSSAAFRLTDSGNNAWRGQALEVNYEPCTR